MGFNIYVDYDFKSFIKQIKSADKLNCKFSKNTAGMFVWAKISPQIIQKNLLI